MCAQLLSLVRLFSAPWTVAHQTTLSVGFSRQESWSGLPCPPPGNLPDPGMEPESLMSPALAGGFFTTAPPGKPRRFVIGNIKCSKADASCWKRGGQSLNHWKHRGGPSLLAKDRLMGTLSSGSQALLCYSLSRDQLFVTPWTVAGQASLSMGFPRQEYWSELPYPSPGKSS